MSKLKAEVIKYSKKLNITNLSALRSGNISVRVKEKGIDGFYITPSGMKYSALKISDIVFVSLKGIFDKKKNKPSSEWRFHQDIYVNKKNAKAIVHAHSTCATAVSAYAKSIPAFHYMVASYKGREPYGMEEPEQIRPVNYYLHTTRGVIDLVGDAEVKRKPKDLTNRIPTDLSDYPQWDSPVPYLGKELFKDYWDCPEKATGLFQRAMDYYLKYVRPREIAAAEQAAAEKAAEEQYQAALKRSY